MGILGGSAEECYDKFRAHVAAVMAATLRSSVPLCIQKANGKATLSFVQGGPTTVAVRTRLGTLHFSFSQALEAVREERRSFRLRTVGYWYRLQLHPGLTQQALIRWEYEASESPYSKRPARHHVQIAAEVKAGNESLNLNKLHVPTGRVPFEEILRFLIADLGASPPCGDKWPATLADSEKAFYTRFAAFDYPSY